MLNANVRAWIERLPLEHLPSASSAVPLDDHPHLYPQAHPPSLPPNVMLYDDDALMWPDDDELTGDDLTGDATYE